MASRYNAKEEAALNTLQQSFSSSSFDPHSYVKLSNHTTLNELKAEQEQLKALAEKNSLSLKLNVFRNYKQYVETSKAVSKLEAELFELGTLLNDQTGILHGLNEIITTGSAPGIEQALSEKNRLKPIEKLDVSNPLIFGDVMHQSKLELLDLDTKSVIEPVYCALLPNALVIARIKVVSSSREHLVLRSLHATASLSVEDIWDSEGYSNAFEVSIASEQFLFSANTLLEKKAWLAALRKCSLNAAGDVGAKEGNRQAQHTWLLDLPEELDVCIAQRAFDNAVELVERARLELNEIGYTHKALGQMRGIVEDKVSLLTQTLCAELERAALRPRAVVASVLLLLRIGEPRLACTKYLESKTESIKRDFRKLKIEGATELYVYKLSSIFFMTLRATSREFQTIFKPSSLSMFVTWALKELREYAAIFIRQVLDAPSLSLAVMAEAVSVARAQCSQLADEGIDFEHALLGLLQEGCERVIEAHGQNLLSALAHAFVDEQWEAQQFSTNQAKKAYLQQLSANKVLHPEEYLEGSGSPLFACTVLFHKEMTQFSKSLSVFYFPELAPTICAWISKFFLMYMNKLSEAYTGQPIFQTNAVFCLDIIFPQIRTILEKKALVTLPEISHLEGDISEIWTQAASDEGITHV